MKQMKLIMILAMLLPIAASAQEERRSWGQVFDLF